MEGKIFFAVFSRRMTSYVVDNGYVYASVQKGGIPGLPGSLEHTIDISQLIKEAKETRGDLAVIWMDLANGYGSVPHKLIETVLEHDHIPEKITTIVKEYLERIHLRFRMGGYVTSWQRLEKGIVNSICRPFRDGMNLLIEAGRRETRGPKTKEDIRQPPSRGYMDDLTITTTTHVQAKCVQEAMEETATWARMKFYI